MKLALLLALCCATPALAQSPDDVAHRIQMVRALASAQQMEWGEAPHGVVLIVDTTAALSSGRIARVAIGGWFQGAVIGAGVGAVVGYALSSDDDFFGKEGGAILLGIVGAATGGAVGAPLAAYRKGAGGGILAVMLGIAVPIAIVDKLDEAGGGGLGVIALFPVSAVASTVFSDWITR